MAKDTTQGVAEGLDQGRKAGESVDGAVIVSSAQELSGKGTVVVHAVTEATIVLAAENTSDRPVRLTKLNFVGLDREGFATKLTGPVEVTVAPHAKEKITVTSAGSMKGLAKVRYWTIDLPLH